MAAELRKIAVREAQEKLRGGTPMVDVREYPEWVEGHVAEARLVPLATLKQNPAAAHGGREEVLVLCRTGRRAVEAAQALAAAGCRAPLVVEGGLEAWRAAGLPVERARGPISLERQVRIAAGTLVLLGLLVPGLQFLPYVVGAGLIFAGITDTCAMGLLLARLPWNRPRSSGSAAG
jgi:rhodanese-related sulfurtransferase